MLDFSKLQTLIHAALKFLTECVHFVLLLGHQLSLCGENFLVAVLQVLSLFFVLHFICAQLDLMGILIVLLFGKRLLDTSEVEEFRREFELHGEILLKVLSILF